MLFRSEAGSNEGPDYIYGWGLMNTYSAIQKIDLDFNQDNNFYIREVNLRNSNDYEFQAYSDGHSPIKITICWTDYPGTPPIPTLNSRTKMLVNDLDIRLTKNSNSSIFFPYTLNPDNPSNAPVKQDNNTDNVEQVFISTPLEGFYNIRVSHKGTLTNGHQDFSMIMSGLTPNIQPTLLSPKNREVNVGISDVLRWYSLPDSENYLLQISNDLTFQNIVYESRDISATTTSIELANCNLLANTTYYWRVAGVINGELSSYSTFWSFHTNISFPSNYIFIGNIEQTEFCLGDEINIPYTIFGDFSSSNNFFVQISDNYGSFENPIIIGYIHSNQNGNIQCLIPTNISSGDGYRLRIVSSNPVIYSNDDGISLSLNECIIEVPWEYIENTGIQHTILVPSNINPIINQREMLEGDAIGFFYSDNEQYYCGGYGIWNGNDLEITLWGDNPNTEEKDGFSINENFTIKLWDSRLARECNAQATYRQGDPDNFQNDGITYLESINTLINDEQILSLQGGWNLISSYIEPLEISLEILLDDLDANLILLKNNSGQIFYPAMSINEIGQWNCLEGYLAYITFPTQFSIFGTKLVSANTPIALTDGWNIIPFLKDTELNIYEALSSIMDNILIVKDMSGNIFIPSMMIDQIGFMVSGQAYQIYMLADDVLIYP